MFLPPYPRTATEAAWVQEGEDVEADGSRQQAREVSGQQGELSTHAALDKAELLHGAALDEVAQHQPPLPVRPLGKLTSA